MNQKKEFSKKEKELIENFKKKWFEIGTKIGNCSKKEKKECEDSIKDFYVFGNKKPPEHIIWTRSPLEAEKLIFNFEKIARDTNDCKIVMERLINKSEKLKREFVETYFWGQQDSYWIAFYLCGEKFGCKYNAESKKQLDGFSKIAQAAFWWYPFENVCIISERPNKLKINERDLLHADGESCLEFSDGFELFFLNGIEMPKNIVVEKREDLHGNLAFEIENIDVRREFIKKIGIEKFIKDTNAKTISHWSFVKEREEFFYELLEVDLGKEAGKHKYLKMSMTMKNGEVFYFVEGVSDDCKTAEEAFYWRYPRLKEKSLPDFIS
jgi:hypothetical protein